FIFLCPSFPNSLSHFFPHNKPIISPERSPFLFSYRSLFCRVPCLALPYLLPLLIIIHYNFLFILCSICIDYTFFCILFLIYQSFNIYQSYIIPYISSYRHAILCPYIPLKVLCIGSLYPV